MDVEAEFEGADFGDKRLSRRLIVLASDISEEPADSFPDAAGSAAALEATYRFLNNERVSPERILAPHVRRTVERCAEAGRFIVAHDTTEVGFSTPRNGLGRVNDGEEGRGCFLHLSLAISLDGSRNALGVVGAWTHTRHGKPTRKKTRHSERKPEPQRESRRWSRGIEEVQQLFSGGTRPIHVCDREADNYLLFARALECEAGFVIRASHDRRIEDETLPSTEPTIKHALKGLEGRVEVEIVLSPRKAKFAPKGSPKRSRTAKLEFCATTLTICCPQTRASTKFPLPDSIELNLVHVREVDPPLNCEPVDWKLLTTEPIDTPDQIRTVVEIYDTRWVIEEYFKALKTGCAIEKRQLESAQSIFNALAVFLPIAWVLLRLRHLARHEPNVDARTVFTDLQLKLLRRHPKSRMADELTVHAAMAAVARLGGHIKQNGDPGWQVLGRGYLKLLAIEEGALLASLADL